MTSFSNRLLNYMYDVYPRNTTFVSKLVLIIKTPRLTIDCLDEVFIKFWTLEGAITERGAAITIWRLKSIELTLNAIL